MSPSLDLADGQASVSPMRNRLESPAKPMPDPDRIVMALTGSRASVCRIPAGTPGNGSEMLSGYRISGAGKTYTSQVGWLLLKSRAR